MWEEGASVEWWAGQTEKEMDLNWELDFGIVWGILGIDFGRIRGHLDMRIFLNPSSLI
jgi:hypothetical protein